MSAAINLTELESVQTEDIGPLTRLQHLDRVWYRRAQVRQPLKEDPTWQAERPDFLESLLPFAEHPLWHAAEHELKQTVLSLGWLAYNWKTVDIESHIISPSCIDLLYGRIPCADYSLVRNTVSQALVDEAYHIMIVVHACQATRVLRNLSHIKLGEFNLTRSMEREKARHAEPWKKSLVQLATAIVSEVFISDYLGLLSEDESIQPLNRATVHAHRQDELAHSSLFKQLTKLVFQKLNTRERQFFTAVLPLPVRWFANQELDLWECMLQQVEFPGASSMISELRHHNDVNLQRVDYQELVDIAQEIGLLDSPDGRLSFNAAGLAFA